MSKQTRKNPSKPATAGSGPRNSKTARGKSAPPTPAKSGRAKLQPADAKMPKVKSAKSKAATAKTPTTKASAGKASAARTGSAKTAKAATATSKASPLAVLVEGAPAPGFTLPRDGGENVMLASFSGQKLVLFFYPRANTPGCTKEAIDFSRLKPAFAASETAVLGVSADSVKAQDSFRDKHGLTMPLLSDPTHAMLSAYGVWGEKTLYGRKFEGIIRTTVLIGRDGTVARIWRNVKVDGHADEVLAAAQLL